MVKKILAQLERLAFWLQSQKIKKNYPTLSGIRMSAGLLWQHPGGNRQKILASYNQRLNLDRVRYNNYWR